MDSACRTSNCPNFTIPAPLVVDNKQSKYEEKKALFENELKRMTQLPSHSTYVLHRIRVLNKLFYLLSLQVELVAFLLLISLIDFSIYCSLFLFQRSASEEVELELLFAGLSL